MASSSSSHPHAFSGIEPPGTRTKVSESTKIYDVFINHRGPDVKDTLARQLYDSLQQLGIRAFLDKEEMELGQSFPSSIETAIHSAAVHIAIFSKSYAESPWCLAELVLMQQSQAKIIPVFYGVQPWELRHIDKGVYAGAFIEYEKKSRYQEKHREWKEALQSISFTTGCEIKNINDIQRIVSEVEKEVQRKISLHVCEYPVALDKLVREFERRCLRERVRDFENQCGMTEGEKGRAWIVGIFRMGGVGKTTLSKELFNLKRQDYARACFLFDVREASARCELPSLQMKLLRDLFGEKEVSFQSVEEGSNCICNRIARSDSLSFLIVLDDIDHLEQLDALFIRDMVKKPGSTLVIITTRDVGVLISAGIQAGYHLKGMDVDDARELFSWHAFSQPHPADGYVHLVDAFVGVCRGLPLSLRVLGRHVHGRKENYWRAELEKVGTTLHRDIQRKLKISFDALDNEEKQIFLDIACFFVDRQKCMAMRIWKASGWNADSGLRKLQDKCLIEEVEDPIPVLRMHDHLRDLGRELASEFTHPPRLWRPRDLKYLESKRFKNILAKTEGRCFHSIFDDSLKSTITFFLGNSNDRSRTSSSLLYLDANLYSSHINHLRRQQQPRIPLWASLENVHYLRVRYGYFKELWRDSEAPSQLKELKIDETILEQFPDFLGISTYVDHKTVEAQQKSKMKLLVRGGRVSGFFPMIPSRKPAIVKPPLNFLEDLVIRRQENVIRIAINGEYCPSLRSFNISSMKNLTEVQFTRVSTLNCLQVSNCEDLQTLSVTSDLTKLEEMEISACPQLEEPSLCGLSCLRRFTIADSNLKSVPGITSFEKLVELNINRCQELHELCLAHLCCLQIVAISSCYSLKCVTGISSLPKLVNLTISLCWKLKLELCLVNLKYLEKITVDASFKVKSFKLDGCNSLETVQGSYDFQEIRMVNIHDCPELRELPPFSGASRLETITINGCDKLNHLQLTDCAILKRFMGNFDPNGLSISDCPMLQELPGFGQVKCLEEIRIFWCGSLENLTFPTVLKRLELNACGELRGMSAISGLTELVELKISNCLQLHELCIANLSLLKKLALANLKTVSGISHLRNLVELRIHDSLEVELFLSSMTRLEIVAIVECEKLCMVTVPTNLMTLNVEACSEIKSIVGICDLPKLVELDIKKCPHLQQELHLSRLNCLKGFTIVECWNISNVTLPMTLNKLKVQRSREFQMLGGVDNPNMLTDIHISECSELEMLPSLERLHCLKRMTVQSCEKLHSVTLPNTVIKLTVENCRELRRITMDFKIDCFEFSLVQLSISDCPELQDLPCLQRLNSLEEIRIIRCAQLQELAFPITLSTLQLNACTELKNLSYVCHLKNLVHLSITQCWQLEIDLHLEGMKSLQRVIIDGCRRLESVVISKCKNLRHVSGNFDGARLSLCECPDNVAGIEELGRLEAMQLLYCSNAAIRNCIFKLKSVPSDFVQVVARSEKGAMENLNSSLFPNAHFCPDITSLHETLYHRAGSVGAIIICTVVDINRPAPLHTLSKSHEVSEWNVNLRQGESLITTVVTSRFYQTLYRCQRFEDCLVDHGTTKNWCALTVKKGKERRSLHLLRTIMDKLHPENRIRKRRKFVLV